MTAPRRDGQHQTGFAKWVRNVPELDSIREGFSCLDIDWVWHRYMNPSDSIGQRYIQHIMLIEEKSYGAEVGFSQRDTIMLLDQALRHAVGSKGITAKNARGRKVKLRYWGWNTIQYQGNMTSESEWIKWNNRQITMDELIGLLRFELHPQTLAPIDANMRRHHVPPLDLYNSIGFTPL